MHIVSLKTCNSTEKKHIKHFSQNNKALLILTLFFLIGLFFGSILIRFFDVDTFKFFKILLLSDLTERTSASYLSIFIKSISAISIFILPAFLMGLSAWGFVAAPIIPFLRGICIGLSSGYIYSLYGFKDICCYSLTFLPGIFVSTIAILLITKESSLFSISCFSLIFLKNTAHSTTGTTKRYIFKTLSLMFLAIIAAGIDVLFSLVFAHFLAT